MIFFLCVLPPRHSLGRVSATPPPALLLSPFLYVRCCPWSPRIDQESLSCSNVHSRMPPSPRALHRAHWGRFPFLGYFFSPSPIASRIFWLPARPCLSFLSNHSVSTAAVEHGLRRPGLSYNCLPRISGQPARGANFSPRLQTRFYRALANTVPRAFFSPLPSLFATKRCMARIAIVFLLVGRYGLEIRVPFPDSPAIPHVLLVPATIVVYCTSTCILFISLCSGTDTMPPSRCVPHKMRLRALPFI